MRKTMLAVASVLIMLSVPVLAEDSCDTSCPTGKIRISFADGNHTTCVCVDQGGAMQETPSEGGPTCVDTDDDGTCD